MVAQIVLKVILVTLILLINSDLCISKPEIQLRKDQPDHAMVLFAYNLKQNPHLANVYDSMGDGLVALGKMKEAVSYYEKAVQLGEKSQHRDLGLFKKNLASVKQGI